MSYSRWGGSVWYTFNHVNGGFAAWYAASNATTPIYTNEQVKQMLRGDWSPLVPGVSDEERDELRVYMLRYAWDEMQHWMLESRRDLVEEMVNGGLLSPEVLEDDWIPAKPMSERPT